MITGKSLQWCCILQESFSPYTSPSFTTPGDVKMKQWKQLDEELISLILTASLYWSLTLSLLCLKSPFQAPPVSDAFCISTSNDGVYTTTLLFVFRLTTGNIWSLWSTRSSGEPFRQSRTNIPCHLVFVPLIALLITETVHSKMNHSNFRRLLWFVTLINLILSLLSTVTKINKHTLSQQLASSSH